MPLEAMYCPRTDIERSFGWLLYFLDFTRNALCSDTRDKVYAILSATDPHFNNQLCDYVRPNYDISVASLYTEITMHILNHSRFLDPISFVEHRRSGTMSSILPS